MYYYKRGFPGGRSKDEVAPKGSHSKCDIGSSCVGKNLLRSAAHIRGLKVRSVRSDGVVAGGCAGTAAPAFSGHSRHWETLLRGGHWKGGWCSYRLVALRCWENRYRGSASLSLACLVAASNRYICRDPEKIKEMFKDYCDADLFQNRVGQLLAFKGDLPAFLNLIDTEWLAPADARHLSFPDNSFDFHFSYAVFEHVPESIIRDILKEAKRLLRPEGVLSHSIDLSDHFAYTDNSITKINFLQFSDERWQTLAGNQYMYHNRLRAPEFFRLFEEEGVFIARKAGNLDAQSLEALKRRFPLDARFASTSPEELAITNINIVGSFSRTRAQQIAQTFASNKD